MFTSGGATAGPGALVDAMIRAAGFKNLQRRPGYGAVNLERLILEPPTAFILGFFDVAVDAFQRWSIGHNAALTDLTRRRPRIALPAAILGCPAWFAADGAALHGRRTGVPMDKVGG